MGGTGEAEGGSRGRGYVYTYNRVCCTAETNTTWESNYTSILKKGKKMSLQAGQTTK